VATQRRDGFTIEVVLHPGDLSDLLAPSFPDAACRDHIDLFDAAAGRPNRLEVASAREIAPLTLRLLTYNGQHGTPPPQVAPQTRR
jgi:hypothetical protein